MAYGTSFVQQIMFYMNILGVSKMQKIIRWQELQTILNDRKEMFERI